MKQTWITPWAPMRPDAWLRRPPSRLPHPLDEDGCRVYEFARQGLWHGVAQLALGDGDEVLVPAYNHGSEVEVLQRAGLRPRFYGAGDSLVPDPDELDALVGPRTRALYLIHYLGRGQDSARWRSYCDERGLHLIEDVAMAWLARRDGVSLGTLADLAIYSPWKTYGLFDVGAMTCIRTPAPVPPARRTNAGFLLRSQLRWLAGRSPLVGEVVRKRRASAPAVTTMPPPDEWGLLDPDAGPSALSLFLLRRLCAIDAAARRRANYERLHAVLGDWVAPGFEGLDDESSPFVFPIASGDKHGLIAALADQGIETLDLWALPHPGAPGPDEFPAAARRRATTVGLPVHQELREQDVDRIASAALDYLRDGRRSPRRGAALPAPGDPAPPFELLDQDGKAVRLGDHDGQSIVLYFYPEADTPGCTAQACALRDARSGFRHEGAVVLGVSPDPVAKLGAFADAHGLPFTLLSDEGHRVADAYGVWRPRSRLRGRAGESERTTFLIGPDGRIRRVFRNVDPEHHDALVLAELRAERAATAVAA